MPDAPREAVAKSGPRRILTKWVLLGVVIGSLLVIAGTWHTIQLSHNKRALEDKLESLLDQATPAASMT
jgi:hypothetical protein